MNRPIKVWHVLVLVVLLTAVLLKAQTPPVMFFASTSGTTITNCGTPTTPSLCGVGTGWYVWTNATSGWVQVGIPATTPVASITVCNLAATPVCQAPATGAVTLKIPSTATLQ